MPVFITTTDAHSHDGWLESGEVRQVFLKPYDLDALVEAIRGGD